MLAILHIGVEKTGTTSIQQFLALNREDLKSRSILFPQSPGSSNHMRLAGYAANDEKRDDIRMREQIESHEDLQRFRDTFAADFASEVRAAGCDTIILSGEHCSSRLVTHQEVQRLRDLLFGVFTSVRVVVYLRRQDEFLLSTYSTMVKCGHTERLAIPSPDDIRDRYDFAKMLDLWSSIFGREFIEARLYSPSSLVDGNAVSDFIKVAGLPADLPYAMPGRENPSLDATTLEFLRLVNRHVPYTANGKIFQPRDNLPRLLETLSTGPGVMTDADQLAAFMRSFAGSNNKVATDYFGGAKYADDDPLFGPAPFFGDRAIPEPMTLEKAVEIFGAVWVLKNRLLAEARDRQAKARASSASPTNRK